MLFCVKRFIHHIGTFPENSRKMASQKVHLRRYTQALSLRRTHMNVSFLGFRKPCIWSFLLCHYGGENLQVHQKFREIKKAT